MDINDLRQLYANGVYHWTDHILVRMIQKGISENDIESVLMDGEIIEEYPSDYPYPSCLVIGRNTISDILHVVCGIGDNSLWLITAYYPSQDKWDDGYKTRKGRIL